MGNRIAVVLSALRYAEATQRSLIVDWNDNTYAMPDGGDTFTSLWDAPEVSAVRLEELGDVSVYPAHWQGRLLNYRNKENVQIMPYKLAFDAPPGLEEPGANEADVVVVTRDGPKNTYIDSFNRMVPSELVRRRIDEASSGIDWSRTIGAQIRHGNGERYLTPASTRWFHARLAELSRDLDMSQIFLATDCAAVVEEFEHHYESLVTVPKWYPALGSGPIHHHPNCPDRFAAAVDAIVDIWLLARCRQILICDGGFGRAARHISGLPQSMVEVYPDKIYASVEEKREWNNPI